MNDEPKFTPGPWFADNGKVYCVADNGKRWYFFVTTEADAALIAAAPEMYGLLERMRTELRRVEFSNLDDANKCANMILNIETVLKKSRGEEC